MPFQLIPTSTFDRNAKKFGRQHPELKNDVVEVLTQLEADPFTPKLRLHPLRGKFTGKHAVSLTYSHRIVLVLRVTAKEIVLLDIGTHDEVYRD